MIFPNWQNFQIRNMEFYIKCQERGTENLPYYGVKGYSPLIKIIMLPEQLPIDYMHLICLGIFKALCMRLFSAKFSGCSFFIGKFKIYF